MVYCEWDLYTKTKSNECINRFEDAGNDSELEADRAWFAKTYEDSVPDALCYHRRIGIDA